MNTTSDRRVRLRRLRDKVGFGLLIVGICAFALFPIAWTVLTALKPEDQIVTRHTVYLPDRFTLDNFTDFLAQADILRFFGNSLVVALLTVAICLTFGSLAGYSVSRNRSRIGGLVLIFYVSIRMFPAVLMLVPLFIILRDVHLLDTYLGLALAYTTFLLPAVVWIMKGFFDAVPIEIEDAARVDGCSRLGTLVRVTIPLALPGLGATALLVAISSWNEYLFALLLTNSAGARTWPVGIQLLIGEFALPWGKLAAAGVISILPICVAYAFMGRTLIRGLTAGAVK